MIFAYHSTLVHLKELGSTFVRIKIAEHCVCVPLSFFSAALIGGPFDYMSVFERAKALAESGILLAFPRAVQVFVADIGLFSIL